MTVAFRLKVSMPVHLDEHLSASTREGGIVQWLCGRVWLPVSGDMPIDMPMGWLATRISSHGDAHCGDLLPLTYDAQGENQPLGPLLRSSGGFVIFVGDSGRMLNIMGREAFRGWLSNQHLHGFFRRAAAGGRWLGPHAVRRRQSVGCRA